MCGFLGKGFMVPFAGVAVDNGRDGDRVAGREFEVDARSLSGSRLEWRACMVTEAPLKGMGSWLAAASRERDRLFLERERERDRVRNFAILVPSPLPCLSSVPSSIGSISKSTGCG